MIPLHLRIKDGRTYITSRRTADTIYLKCKNIAYCFATARINTNNMHEIIEYQEHSAACYPDPNAMQIAQFKDALKQSLSNHAYDPRALYDSLALVYRDAAIACPFESLKQSMKLWLRKLYPANPESFEQLALQLANPRNEPLLEYDRGQLTTITIRDARNDIHIGFFDAALLRHVEDAITEYLMDSTYQTAPQLGEQVQLFTLMGIYHDHAIPLMWFVMSRKTEDAYTAVIEEVARRMPYANFRVVGSDFEIAQRNPIRRIFPEAFIASCHFHYCRAILGKVRNLQLADFVENNAEAHLFTKKLLALAFLPEEMIRPAFEQLCIELSRMTFTRLRPLIEYYNNFWLNTIGAVGISIFGLSLRTNNIIESYHSRLLHRLGAHPTAWAFIRKLKVIMIRTWRDIESMERGRAVQRQMRYLPAYRNNELQRAWRLLYLQRLSPARFLVIGANLIGTEMIRKMNLLSPARLAEILTLETQFQNAVALNNQGIDPRFDFGIIAAYSPNERLQIQNNLRRLQNGAAAAAAAAAGDEEIPENEGNDAQEEGAVPAVPAAQNALHDDNRRRRRVRRRRRRRPLAQAREIVPAVNVENNQARLLAADPPINQADGEAEAAMQNAAENADAAMQQDDVNEDDAALQQEDVNEDDAMQEDGNNDAPAEAVCVVCLMAPKSKAFIPCGHYACCERCADRIWNSTRLCPVCRARSNRIVRIFF